MADPYSNRRNSGIPEEKARNLQLEVVWGQERHRQPRWHLASWGVPTGNCLRLGFTSGGLHPIPVGHVSWSWAVSPVLSGVWAPARSTWSLPLIGDGVQPGELAGTGWPRPRATAAAPEPSEAGRGSMVASGKLGGEGLFCHCPSGVQGEEVALPTGESDSCPLPACIATQKGSPPPGSPALASPLRTACPVLHPAESPHTGLQQRPGPQPSCPHLGPRCWGE